MEHLHSITTLLTIKDQNITFSSVIDQDSVVLDNYYTGQPLTIALDKALTPNQNAQRYFKRYQKLKDIPGSHVVITGNLDPSDEVKTDAAELAAYFSKGRLSNLVQVDMIESKKLNKPSDAKPGFVTYTGQKTLRVTPTEEKIKSMKL